ncbi:MAG: flagellar assembly protein FliW [Intestinimonas sp.]|jgi:flagellar assembly factor FliW|nr:flagellar assembly protein FliW [Intestinimonas sp.]
MQINSKYFGQIEYRDTDVLHFKSGLFGFEQEEHFLLLPFAGSAATLLCFQSIATPELAFVAMNPFALKSDYTPVLSKAELNALGVGDSTELSYYVLCVVKSPVSQSTVNLKCPVAVNEDTGEAVQVILETQNYEMRHLLSEFRAKEGETAC